MVSTSYDISLSYNYQKFYNALLFVIDRKQNNPNTETKNLGHLENTIHTDKEIIEKLNI